MKLTPAIIKAAEYVLQNYLSKPYKDMQGMGRINGHKRLYIDRPVHGLVHTLRTLAYAPLFLDLLKKKQPNEYNRIDEKELEKIMIAQLFFVAGRECEKSDSDSYDNYHELGAQYFEQYAQKELTHLFSDKKDIEKYAGIIADVTPWDTLPEATIVRWSHAVELMRARESTDFFIVRKPLMKKVIMA